MLVTIALLLQSTVTPAPVNGKIDLTRLVDQAPPCPASQDGEITVCAKPDEQEQYRLHPLPPREAEQHRPLDFGLFGQVRGDVHAEQTAHQGIPDKRVVMTLKMPF